MKIFNLEFYIPKYKGKWDFKWFEIAQWECDCLLITILGLGINYLRGACREDT